MPDAAAVQEIAVAVRAAVREIAAVDGRMSNQSLKCDDPMVSE